MRGLLLCLTFSLFSYTPPEILIPEVHLNFAIFDQKVIIQNEMSIIPITGTSKPISLLGNNLKLRSLSINGKHLTDEDYTRTETELIIHTPPATLFTLDIETELTPQSNADCIGLYSSEGALLTKCEPQGFRNITYAADRPDILSHYTVTLEADKTRYPHLLSNGNLTESLDLESNRHSCTYVDPFLKPSYLFAIVAGNFELLEDTFTTCSGREVLIQCYVDQGEGDRAHFGLKCLKRAMRWDEKMYGRKYDLDNLKTYATKRYAVGGSASENKGLLIFDSQYFLCDANDSYYKRRKIEEVISHEYFHNWTGNRVTIRDWMQLGLKEGLTCFRGSQYMHTRYGDCCQRIREVARLLSGPHELHPVLPEESENIQQFYDSTTYRKAPEIFRMLHLLIGEREWSLAMEQFFERFDQDHCSLQDFIHSFEESTNRSLTQFFRWFTELNAPEVEILMDQNSTTKRVTLKLIQRASTLFHFPFVVAFIDTDGSPIESRYEVETAHEHLISITQSEAELHFDGIEVPVIPSLWRGFCAPIENLYPYTEDELYTLFEFDTDPINRYLIAQKLVQDGMKPRFKKAMLRLIENQDEDPGFITECLHLLTGTERIELGVD